MRNANRVLDGLKAVTTKGQNNSIARARKAEKYRNVLLGVLIFKRTTGLRAVLIKQ